MTVKDLLETSIDGLPRTQARTVQRLRFLGIESFFDLLNHFPHRYHDFTRQFERQSYNPDQIYSLQGTVLSLNQSYTRNRKTIQKCIVETGHDQMEAIWFNQQYLVRAVPVGSTISISGKITFRGNRPVVQAQSYELVGEGKQPLHTSRLVPVYPETWGISSKTIREKIAYVLQTLRQTGEQEILPEDIVSAHSLFPFTKAFQQIHFPDSYEYVDLAKKRLAFDELFFSHMRSLSIRRQWESGYDMKRIPRGSIDHLKAAYTEFINRLPFQLTSAQANCLEDIMTDLAAGRPMNRFIQGDVGSGKTIIAVFSAYLLYTLGYKSVIMAPTEVLAEQHFHSFRNFLSENNIRIGLHTATRKAKAGEEYDIIIGTHALLSGTINLKEVGLVVIDEQHRFGVKQRALLRNKTERPHVLTMTATPIPRTISLTTYGDLDVSVLHEKPQGRLPIKTFVVPERKRENAYDWIKKEIDTHGTQVFVICPLIAESENETMKSVRAASQEYERLAHEIFPDYSVALLHGKQKAKEKEAILQDFKKKSYHILVSTSVVEVGIDIPNATVMIIEGAERYGLAQLHQLRGRVGRGDKQSYCLLFTSQAGPEQMARLQFFAKNEQGIDLAEYDLQRRGPGSIFGIEQHGRSLLKFADMHTVPFIQAVKKSAAFFDSTYLLSDYPVIEHIVHTSLHDLIARD